MSLKEDVRLCVPRAPSLKFDYRPPRITRNSYGPRVPNRTMVANDNCSACEFQNGLASSRRYDENRLERNRKPLGRRVQHSNGWRGGSEPNLFKHVGLEAREIPAVGEVFSLDFPLYRTSSSVNLPVSMRCATTGWARPPNRASRSSINLRCAAFRETAASKM